MKKDLVKTQFTRSFFCFNPRWERVAPEGGRTPQRRSKIQLLADQRDQPGISTTPSP